MRPTLSSAVPISPEGDKLVTVYTNLSAKSIGHDTAIEGIGKSIASIKQYTTSQNEDLSEKTLDNDQCSIQPNSVVTIVYQFK